MLACILKTKAEKFSLLGSTIVPSCSILGCGLGDSSRNFSKKLCTPKLVIALPKNIGVSSPAFTFSISNSSPAISSSSMSLQRFSYNSSPSSSRIFGSSREPVVDFSLLAPWLLSSSNSSIVFSRRLYTPL